MRFLLIVTANASSAPRAPDPDHMAKVRRSIAEKIASGSLLATGAIGKRATSAARITRTGEEITVEDPPEGEGWMAAGGYSLTEYPSKEAAIAGARATLEIMGDGVVELIQVSELHPPPGEQPQALDKAT